MFAQKLSGGLNRDPGVPPRNHIVDCLRNLFRRDSGLNCEVAGMELHVSSLDSLKTQSLNGSEVLREAHH